MDLMQFSRFSIGTECRKSYREHTRDKCRWANQYCGDIFLGYLFLFLAADRLGGLYRSPAILADERMVGVLRGATGIHL